jgi:hypothetical protein
MGQRRLTEGEQACLRYVHERLKGLKNGGVEVDYAISNLNRILENDTTNGLSFIEPKLTEDDAKNRRLVMVRDRDEYAWHGPQKLVAIEGDYFITSKVDGSGGASWRQCRPATKEEIKAAGLLTPEEVAKAKRLEDMVNAKWLGGGDGMNSRNNAKTDKCLTLPRQILFELPTEGDPLYILADLPHLPKAGDEIYFRWPEDWWFDVQVQTVRYQFNWGRIVVQLSEVELGEDPEVEKALLSDGWLSWEDAEEKWIWPVDN